MIKIKRGLDLPIMGEANQETIHDGFQVTKVALIGPDYIGMKPTMHVQVGDKVKKGQVLFADKKLPDVIYTSPGCGEVVAINRGKKRVFQSIEIELKGEEEETFSSFKKEQLPHLKPEEVKQLLIDSGTWPSIRSRPYSKVADPSAQPSSLFITAMDSNPLAPSVEKIISDNEQAFVDGVTVLTRLVPEKKVYLCTAEGSAIAKPEASNLQHETFKGPHPAGNVGTHIHFLDPVSIKKSVWYIGYQDVIAIGKLFVTGKLATDRVVSLAGPGVKEPRLIRTRFGANLTEALQPSLHEGEMRIVSGSVFSGRTAKGPFDYLGRFHNQISVLLEGREREFLGWQSPGINKFSVKNIYVSKFFPNKKFPFTTSTNGSKRAMVPIGSYEQVMPLDIIPTFLLRSLLCEDTEQAQRLGCLELDEEDLALCTFVCQSKYNYGPVLRKNLEIIEKEG